MRVGVPPGETRSRYEQIKGVQRDAWETGDFGMIGTSLQIVSEELCEQADLRAGSTVLDVCTGTGNTAIAAARRRCRVTGLDYAPSLLGHARERAAAERLTIDFRDGDVEAIPFETGGFDAVMSTFGVQFAPNHAAAGAELVRVCRRGGRIALVNWGPGDLVADVFKASARHLPPPPGTESPLRWGELESVTVLLEGATCISSEVKAVTYRFESTGHFVDHLRTYYGPTMKAFDAAGAGSDGLRQDLIAVCERLNVSDRGDMVVPARYLAAVFEKD